MQKQKELFERALKNGRLAHAYIFTGSEGAYKADFAKELAQMLGAHPILDVIFADNPEGLTVGEARAIQRQLSLTPVGRAKVAIIAHAENMGDGAANSLLKILEEPPEHSYIFLIADNFYALLPTVVSRVQRVNFVPTPPVAGAGEEFEKIYDILEQGAVADRLMTASVLAEKETAEIQNFLKIAMRKWVENQRPAILGKKLLAAWQDVNYNLNVKLLLDNLFL